MALILSENEIHNHGGMRTAWIYNSLDASITAEVADTMLPLVEADPNAQLFYDFSLAQQQAAFAMAMRGVAVDPGARKLAIKWQEGQKAEALARLAEVVAPHWNNQPDELMPRAPLGRCYDNKLHKWGENGGPCSICGLTRTVQRPFNPEGAAQTMRLLYTYLGLREQLDHKTHKPTSGAKALESLLRNPVLKKGGRSEEAIPVLQAILDERRAQTQLEKLNAPLDHDNRWRCSWNVGGTKTGRWSSSASAFWTGGNLQNIANRARGMFVADPGLVLVYADYKQAESNVCAYDAEDEAYIEAHRSGDVHTDVCRLVWPDAYDWPEDIRDARKLADNPASWDAHHPLRWYGKHIAHGPCHPDMECLTPWGWTSVATKPNAVATWQDGKMVWEYVSWVERAHDGPLVKVDGRHVRQLVTPDHRMIVQRNGQHSAVAAGACRSGKIPTCGMLEASGEVGEDIPEHVARLRMAVWSDGSLSGNKTRFHLKKLRKIARLKQLLVDAGLVFREVPSYGGRVQITVDASLPKTLGDDILRWSSAARRAFLDEAEFWDGHRGRSGAVTISNTDLVGMDIIQSVAAITGMSMTISVLSRPAPRKPIARGHLSRRHHASIEQLTFDYTDDYTGPVYCAVTNAGAFLVRYRGVVSITGNSAIGMTPVGIARDAHVKQALAEQAQKAFFKKFSRLRARQGEIWSEIQQTGELVNPLGRRHPFLGRLVGDGADATRREALAQTQSSMVADWVGIALCRIFHELDGGVRMWQSPSPSHPNRVWLLGQIHDALLFEVRAGDDEAIARVQQLMTFGMMFRGREFRLGVDFHVGKSWRETPEGEAALPTDMTRWVPGMDWSSLR